MIYNFINENIGKRKFFALLIDPENYSHSALVKTISAAHQSQVDFIFIGGSLVSNTLDKPIETIKSLTDIPVLLFPGSLIQISGKADGILLMSLISGRNTEYLIGNHVVAAPIIKKLNLEVIPTGYILVGSGQRTAVEYMSQTNPIPVEKKEIVIATAMAGEMLGQKLIYLEGGSGTSMPVPEKVIRAVRENISVPLIVGGGIKTEEDANKFYNAGADIIVVGNAIEKNIDLIKIVSQACQNWSK